MILAALVTLPEVAEVAELGKFAEFEAVSARFLKICSKVAV